MIGDTRLRELPILPLGRQDARSHNAVFTISLNTILNYQGMGEQRMWVIEIKVLKFKIVKISLTIH